MSLKRRHFISRTGCKNGQAHLWVMVCLTRIMAWRISSLIRFSFAIFILEEDINGPSNSEAVRHDTRRKSTGCVA